MKKYILIILLICLTITVGCVSRPHIKLKTDGIHKFKPTSDGLSTYILILNDRQMKRITSFEGTDEEALALLLTSKTIPIIEYSDGEQSIYISSRSGSGFMSYQKEQGGFFRNSQFIKVQNGKIISQESLTRTNDTKRDIKKSGKQISKVPFRNDAANQGKWFKTQINGYFGIVDSSGDILLPPEYDFIGELNSSRIRVRKNGRFGYVSKDFKPVIKTKYRNAKDFIGDFSIVKEDKQWHFIDINGKRLHSNGYDEIWWNDVIASTLVAVKIDTKKFRGWNFVNALTGKLYPFEAASFSSYEKMKMISINDGHGQSLLLNQNGIPVFPYIFNDITPIDPDRFIASIKNKTGVINRKGEVVIPLQFEKISSNIFRSEKAGEMKDGIRMVFSVKREFGNSNMGLYDYYGRQLLPHKLSDYKLLKNQYVLATKKIGLGVDKKVVKQLYKLGQAKPLFTASSMNYHSSGYLSYYEDGEWGIIDLKGNIIVEPDYPSILCVEKNRFVVKEGNEYGGLDFQENEIVDFDERYLSCSAENFSGR